MSVEVRHSSNANAVGGVMPKVKALAVKDMTNQLFALFSIDRSIIEAAIC